MKIPKCTIGERHKWVWIKNVTISNHTSSGVGMRIAGKYKCACGQRKTGDYQRNKS